MRTPYFVEWKYAIDHGLEVTLFVEPYELSVFCLATHGRSKNRLAFEKEVAEIHLRLNARCCPTRHQTSRPRKTFQGILKSLPSDVLEHDINLSLIHI